MFTHSAVSDSLDPMDGSMPGSPVLRQFMYLSPTEGHLGCFQVLTLKEAAASISVKVFVGW